MTTPEDVLQHNCPTDDYLCPVEANIYNVDFNAFKIRDYDSGEVVFEVDKNSDEPPQFSAEFTDDTYRCIRYTFPARFLKFHTVGTTLVFSVGEKEVPNFRMIERHYFGERLIKSYDFTFGFCIPNSVNSWEAIYPMPNLTREEEEDLIDNPHATRSDSFYFVNDQLIMHNKAEYAYQR
eukprot:GFYU01000580.1.p2 GENE.GFYU01000580.1~~GFYU01000580.1.p2  ORF type:complete len:179 (-),score=41.62 GFYU01000580.1:802-1338(-)